jgi:N utilization substance protein A
MKSELIMALEQIEREKGIKKDDILKKIEEAVVSSLRKHVGMDTVIEASIDLETAEFKAQIVKKVADPVTQPDLEISLAEARGFKKDAAVGDELRMPAPAADFARIAAQTAKQLLSQKFREVERDKLYDEYKPKEGEIVNGSVHRFAERNIIIDLGKAEAILPLREQIQRERYAIGANLRAAILRVDRASHGPQLVLTRAATVFLRRLLELEVPEINEKILEIVALARDPGFRAKVIIKSNDAKIDPVGACVGVRGSRIRSVMAELAGEKIDLIPYSADLPQFLGNALAPAKFSRVVITDEPGKKAEIIVPDSQLSLAIGKDGQNVRLASRLTGWTLDVKAESQRGAEAPSGAMPVLDGVGPKMAGLLAEHGLSDVYRLAAAKVEELTAVPGIGEKTAAKIIASAQAYASVHPR